MLSYPGYILSLLGIIIIIFAITVPIIRAYVKDERGVAMIFAIFKNKPWLVFAMVGVTIFVIGQLLLGKYF